MTLGEFRELTKAMPESAVLEFYHYNILGGYAKVCEIDFIEEPDTIVMY
jgi:hypothetical protein